MRKAAMFGLVLAVAVAVGVGNIAGANVASDGQPTKLVKRAKALGIKEAGEPYTFDEEERSGDPIFLTVEVPTKWADRADSRFTDADTNEEYGAGVRATTDAEQFANSYDVPGVRITAASASSDVDPADLLVNIRYPGCRKSSVKKFDNGVYEGKYVTFGRCDGEATAAVAVDVLGRGYEILVVGVVHTKADLAALDRILRTAKVEKTST